MAEGAGVREVGIDIRARDMASQAIRNVGGSLANLGQQSEQAAHKVGALGKITDIVGKGVGIAFGFSLWGKITQGIGAAKNAMIGYNQTLENSTMALTTMLGSAEDAKTMIADLTTLANKSPFELPNLLQATQNMIAYGFEAERIPEIMTTIGNAAAGLGGSPMKIEAITRALGQMRAKGKLSGEEIRQLAEQGVPALEYLSRGFGKPIPEISKLMEKGLLPLNDAMGYLLEGMDQDFGGMMEKQATTMTGAMSTIRDTFNSTIATAVKPFYDLVSKGLLQVANFMSNPAFMEGAKNIAAGFQTMIDKATGLFSNVTRLVDVFQVGGLPMLAGALRSELTLLGDAAEGKAVAGLRGVHTWLVKTSDSLGPFSAGADEAAVGLLQFQGAMSAFASGDASKATDLLEKSFDSFGEAVEGVKGAFSDLMPQIEDFVTNGVSKITDNLPQIAENAGTVAAQLYMHFATGFSKLVMSLGDIGMKLVDWIAPYVPQVVAALGTFFGAIFDTLLAEVPNFARQMMTFGSKLVDWIKERLPEALDALAQYAQGLFDWIINEGVPKAAAALGPLALEFVEWLIDIAPDVLIALGQLVLKIVEFIAKNLPTLVLKLAEWGQALIEWVVKAIPKLLVKFGEMLGKIGWWVMNEGLPALLKAGADLAESLIEGLFDLILGRKGQPGVQKEFSNFIGNFVTGLGSLAGKLIEGGAALAGNLVKGFANALVNGMEWAINTVIDGINSMLRIINQVGGAVGISIPTLPHVNLPEFEKGAWKIERDMLAIVHKGEMVVPAPVAATVRGERPDSTEFGAGMGGVSLNVTIQTQYFAASEGEARSFARQMYSYLQDEAFRRGQPALIAMPGGS